MELFKAYIAEMLGTHRDVQVVFHGDRPVLEVDGFSFDLQSDGQSLCSPHYVHPLDPFSTKVHRLWPIWQVCSAFPMVAGGRTASLSPPEWGIDAGGLRANVRVASEGEDGERAALLLVPCDLLDSDPATWQETYEAWRARCLQALASGEVEPLQLAFVPPKDGEQEHRSWEDFANDLDLSPGAVTRRVERALPWADREFSKVEARYREIYSLPLPRGLRDLAALIAALGMLPRNPPGAGANAEGEPGWSRGIRWLDEGASLSPGGITEWFAPGGLQRGTHDAAAAYHGGAVPAGGEGPLDARLDMRFRRDAPQFVSFAWGEHSDGHHWGLWYDSPEHRPRIASNWARDSAETWAREEEEMLSFLLAKIDEEIGRWEEQRDEPDEFSYALAHYRAARVVEAHVRALQLCLRERAEPEEPRCPWPRSGIYPIGSPHLALPPGSGTLPNRGIAFGRYQGRVGEAELREAIAAARQELEAGQPAHALGVGLYLHWRDGDDVRQEAAQLLYDAYQALGWQPFADILEVHVLHRDLPGVGVFEEEPWPPELPTPEQLREAPGPLQVAWDWIQSLPGEPALPERLQAHARAERLQLDWHDPVQRAVATWASDEARIRELLSPLR